MRTKDVVSVEKQECWTKSTQRGDIAMMVAAAPKDMSGWEGDGVGDKTGSNSAATVQSQTEGAAGSSIAVAETPEVMTDPAGTEH